MFRRLLIAATAVAALLGPTLTGFGAANAQHADLPQRGGAAPSQEELWLRRGGGQRPPQQNFDHQPRGGVPMYERGGALTQPTQPRVQNTYRGQGNQDWRYRRDREDWRYRHRPYYGGSYYGGGVIAPGLMLTVPTYNDDDCYWSRRYGTWYDNRGRRHKGWHRVWVCD